MSDEQVAALRAEVARLASALAAAEADRDAADAALEHVKRERDALRARLDALESGGLWARVRRVLS